MTNNYPSYRYHPSGKLAIVNNEEEDDQLSKWLKEPPKGFNCPEQAHYHSAHEVPENLKATKKA